MAKSKFHKGQTVYMGRGDKMRELVVAKVIKNPLFSIHQYTFEAPNDGFACGEQSIRATADGKDLQLKDCVWDDSEADFRTNTIANALGSIVDETSVGMPRLSVFDRTRVWFKPSLEMVEWLRDYADGRLIIHVNSGQGHLVKMLRMSGAKVAGIERNINVAKMLEIRSARRGHLGNINEIWEGDFLRHKNLIKSLGNKALLVFTRSDYPDDVAKAVATFYGQLEILMIAEQVSFDTEMWRVLEHKGVSEENEVVYSLKPTDDE